MKHKLLSIVILLLVSVTIFAQQSLKGKVYNSAGNTALAGATISVGGKEITTTDKDGNFTIECSQSKTLKITYVGFEAYSTVITSCNTELSIGLTRSGNYLGDVEITATSNQNKSLLYQPASITKLSSTEIKRGTGLFMDDAINTNIPGVTMQRRAVGSGQQFNIRGYGNGTRGTRGVSSNFDGQGYKVYLNGIPVTDAEGITTMDDIDFGSIGNVEVTKGPAGTLYGLAIAGAVNLKTVRPAKGKTSIAQEILLGNYGLQRYTTSFQAGGERSSILINYGRQKSDGFTIHNESHKDFVNAIGEFNPNDKQAVTAYAAYSNSYDQRFGELTLTQYDTKDYSGNIEYIKRDGHSNVISFRAGVGHTYNFSNKVSNTTTVFGTGFSSNVSSAGGWTDKTAVNYGFRTSFDTKFSLNNNISLSGITGMEVQKQNAQTIGYSMKQNPADPNPTWTWGNPYWIINTATSNNATVTGTSSIFTEWTLALPKDLSITAGVGISRMKIILDDRFNAATLTKPSHYDTSYKSMVSPHVAINKVFSKKLSAYVSYSRGYKAPVSSYFFITTPSVTTPATPATGRLNNLKPEVGDQFEIGTKGSLFKDRLVYQLALFNAVFSNKMTSVAVQLNSTTTAYSYVVNGGKQNHKGVEASVKYTVYQSGSGFFNAITPFVNMTYSDFKYENFKYQTGTTTSNISTVDYSGNAVAGVSKVTANAGVDISTSPGVYFNFVYNYKDGVPVTSDGIQKSRSYVLLNGKLGIQRSLSKHFDFDAYFGVNNITETQFPYMIFVNQLPDAYLPAPLKANYFGGVNLKYNF